MAYLLNYIILSQIITINFTSIYNHLYHIALNLLTLSIYITIDSISCFHFQNLLHNFFKSASQKYITIQTNIIYLQQMLDLVGKGLTSLKSQKSAIDNPQKILHLDLSANKLQQLDDLSIFPNLKTLIVDDNRIQTLESFPNLKHLETFSANKNDFYEINQFMEMASQKFGNLKNLSLLKNPLNPFFQDQKKYKQYQDKIIECFPSIKTIDGCAVQIVKKNNNKQQKQEQARFDKVQMVAGVDERYKTDQVKTVKTKSQGNRFITKNQL